jgi:hypothetical protein
MPTLNGLAENGGAEYVASKASSTIRATPIPLASRQLDRRMGASLMV